MTPKGVLGDLLGGPQSDPKTSQKWFWTKNGKSLKNTKIKLKRKRLQSPPLPHTSDPKRTFSQKKTFFQTSCFKCIFSVIFKHQKTSTIRLSPARELDFQCSTRSSKYVEKPFIFDPPKPLKNEQKQLLKKIQSLKNRVNS